MDGQRQIIAAGHLGELIPRYLERCRLRGRAANTLKAYANDLSHLLRYLGARGITMVQTLGERHLHGWLDAMASGGASRPTQARRLACVRQLLGYAQMEGIIEVNPADWIRMSFRTKVVTAPEMDVLLRMLAGIPTTPWRNLRDRALLRLTLDTGLRASEVANLDLPDRGDVLNAPDMARMLVNVTGKGGRQDTVPFDATTRRWLEQWVDHRMAMAPGRALFCAQSGKRLGRSSLHQIIRRHGDAAGLEGMHMHLLRHRRIGDVVYTLGLEAGSQLARHVSKTTTALVYGRQARSVVHQMIRERAPLGGSA